MKRPTLFSRQNRDRIKALFISVSFFVSILLTFNPSYGQIIQVNPDGTHTLLLPSDTNTSVQVNPEGTHTIIVDHGKTKSYFNPDGTLSTMLNADTNNPILFNPDGTFTQYIRNGDTEIRFNPDGTYCTYYTIDQRLDSAKSNKDGNKSKSLKKSKSRKIQ